jgi:hypothetical protein
MCASVQAGVRWLLVSGLVLPIDIKGEHTHWPFSVETVCRLIGISGFPLFNMPSEEK